MTMTKFDELTNDVSMLIKGEPLLTVKLASMISHFVNNFYLGFDVKVDFIHSIVYVVSPCQNQTINVYQSVGKVACNY